MSRFNSEDAEARYAALQARQNVVRQLLSSQGWRELTTICDGAITGRRQAAFGLMASLRNTEDCFALARVGSEIAGMQFVLGLPHVMLKDIERDLEQALAERRETEDGTT